MQQKMGDGTYTCEINTNGAIGNYTAAAAPIVLPIDIPGSAAQAALMKYQGFTDYTAEGIIYVHAGCRDRNAGVTDLMAAIRYI